MIKMEEKYDSNKNKIYRFWLGESKIALSFQILNDVVRFQMEV